MSAPRKTTATVYLFLVRSRAGYLVPVSTLTRDESRQHRKGWALMGRRIGKRIRVEVPRPEESK